MATEFQPIDPRQTITRTQTQGFVLSGFQLLSLVPKNFPIQTQVQDKEVAKSMFGLPVWSDVTFEAGQYQDLEGRGVISYAPINVQSVLIEVNMSKNIVQNQVAGRNGTVKTYVNDGDFIVNMRGAIVSEDPDVYPAADVEELIRFFTVPDSVRVTSEFLSGFSSISPSGIEGIEQVVITDFSFPQSEGFRNVQLFQCTMLSDAAIELTIDSDTV